MKKLICSSLALVCILSSMVGCGDTKEKDAKEETTTVAETTEATEATTEEAETTTEAGKTESIDSKDAIGKYDAKKDIQQVIDTSGDIKTLMINGHRHKRVNKNDDIG